MALVTIQWANLMSKGIPKYQMKEIKDVKKNCFIILVENRDNVVKKAVIQRRG